MSLETGDIEPALVVANDEIALCETQKKQIDYQQLDQLHYLGNYKRELPVKIDRMMENAHDWEHLPFVHPSSFAAIEKIDSGSWGWRAKVRLSGTGETQLLQLLVDNQRQYWATTVLSGSSQGVHIHTQAEMLSETDITVDVRFYLDDKPQSDEMAAMTLDFLQALYAQLYDEDQILMEGRQKALDQRPGNSGKVKHDRDPERELDLGLQEELRHNLPHVFTFRGHQFCLNRWQGKWVTYGATCPHLLGPLDQAKPLGDGSIACPWHGYRFDICSGRNLDGNCIDLATAPLVKERDGHIFASER